jgi:HlyD family secretion protein
MVVSGLPLKDSSMPDTPPVLLPPVEASHRHGRRLQRWVRRTAFVGILVAAIVTLRMTVFQTKPVEVTVFRAAFGPVEETVTNTKAGSIRSRHRATLSPEIGGRVIDVPARKGARVRRGDILLRLASDDYDAEFAVQTQALAAAVASEQQACDAAELAARELERYRVLANGGLIPTSQLDQIQNNRDATRSACDVAKARTRQARSSLDLASVGRRKTALRAPFDGIVADVKTEVGEWITPSPSGIALPPVVEIIDDRAIYVSAPLDEADLGKVHTGLSARISLDAFPGRTFDGCVVRVAPYVDDRQDQNRTLEIEVEFDDAAFARSLPPGTSADVEVVLERREHVLRVPTSALAQAGTVLVVKNDVLTTVAVTTGLRNWEFVEITSGLIAGDPVVTSLDRVEVVAGAKARIRPEGGR